MPPFNPKYRISAIEKAKAILEQQPVFLDTETTGLNRDDEIVEISIIDFDESILMSELVRPRKKIPDEAYFIHGISNEMVAGEKPFYVLWQEIRSILFGRTIAIYNAEYDLRLLQQTYSQYGQPWRENFTTACIMLLFAEYMGEWDIRRNSYRIYSLEKAGKMMGITLPNSHRAADDARLTRALLIAIAHSKE